MKLPSHDMYVVIVGNDGVDDGPMVWETYLCSASLDEATLRAQYVASRYGGARIAKLQILPIEFEGAKI